ncbi:MAG: VWA domain-containing protein, partial [Oscillospiraceae bacterium]|nr:VWA domain-containing protein [Oscillospiraceae bacterium]
MNTRKFGLYGKKALSLLLALLMVASLIPIWAEQAPADAQQFIGEPPDSADQRTKNSSSGTGTVNDPKWEAIKAADWTDKYNYKAKLDITGKVTGQALRYAFDLIIVTDKSGSMWGGTPPNNRYDRDHAPRLVFLKAALKTAITTFQSKNPDNRVSWIGFGKSADYVISSGWTTDKLTTAQIDNAFNNYYPWLPTDPGNTGDGNTGEGTNWEAGLAKAMDLFKSADAQQKYYSSNGTVVRVPVLIFMTDGMPTLYLSGDGAGSVQGNRVELGENGSTSYSHALNYINGQTAMRNLVHMYSVLTERSEALAIERINGVTTPFAGSQPFRDKLETPKMFNVHSAGDLEATFKKIIDSLAEFEVLSMDDTVSEYYDIDWAAAPLTHVSGVNLRNTTGPGKGTYTDSKGYTYTIERVAVSGGYRYTIHVSVSSSKVTSTGNPVVCSATVTIPLTVRPQYRKTGHYWETNIGNAKVTMAHYTRVNNEPPKSEPKEMYVGTPKLYVGIPIYTNKEDAPNVGAPGDTVKYTFRYTNTTDAAVKSIYPDVAAQQQTAVRLSDLLPPEVYYDSGRHTVSAKIYASHTPYVKSDVQGPNGPELQEPIYELGAVTSEPALTPVVYADNSTGRWAQRLEFSGFALNAGQTVVITVEAEVQGNYWTYSGGANTLLDKSKVTPNGGAAITRSTLNTSSGYETSQGTPQTTRNRDVTSPGEEFHDQGDFAAPKYATNKI